MITVWCNSSKVTPLIINSGSITLPFDLDIFYPFLSRTIAWKKTSWNGSCLVRCNEVITIRATQKKIISCPVSINEVGKKRCISLVLAGQPSVEYGHNAELNQVSNTSGSCSNFAVYTCYFAKSNFAIALVCASLRSRATIQGSGWESGIGPCTLYAGIRCPHHSCRDTHHGLMFSSQWNHTNSCAGGYRHSDFSFTAYTDCLAISVQSTNHCGMSSGSTISPVRLHRPTRYSYGYTPRNNFISSSALTISRRQSKRCIPWKMPGVQT